MEAAHGPLATTYQDTMASLCTSVAAAVVGSAAMCAAYVGCLYFHAGYRREGGRAPDRDDPRVVKERFVRVGVASAVAPCIALGVATLFPHSCSVPNDQSLWTWFGLMAPNVALGTVLPLGLTMVLFLGPLVMSWLDRDRTTSIELQVRERLRDLEDDGLLVLRNLVVGPVTEEWVFRACMCPLLFGAGLPDVANVFTSAFIFGCAHVHHIFDSDVNYLTVAVQFTYTSLFGAYSSYLFLRTGHLLGPLVAHIFCNFMGLPAFARVPNHRYRRTLTAAFVLGLGSFIALTTLDAIYRPALFGSMFWKEH